MYGLCPIKLNQKFSLNSLSVECNVRNLLIACTCEFVYKNDGNEDDEGLFSFPLEYNCVVYYLEALIGGKQIIGVCKEIEEARNLYEAAKEKGQMAAMIEQNRSMMDVFKCRIGNFPKNSEAKIILKFAMELKLSLVRSEIEGVDRFDLALPLILRPRYTPAAYEGDREIFQIDNEYQYNFKAFINGTKIISGVSSVNHILDITFTNENKTCAEINLKSKYDGTKDLDININYLAMKEPSVIYELGSNSYLYLAKDINGAFYKSDVAMVNFLPSYDETLLENQCKFEIVFFVDRSGSMAGSNIDRARECLLIFLKSLPMNCKFQIYGFGSQFDKAFNDSQSYSDQSLSIAMNYQKNLDANFGGTELMRPLQDMYDSPLGSDYSRLAFLLTDGDVGNQDEVTNLVRKNNKTTRLFVIGIGDGVSTSLVDQVSKAGLGKSVFVRNANELSASVIELLDCAINSTLFTDTKLEWKCPQHVSIVTAPISIPPIFSNYFLTVFCMINGMTSDDVIHCTLSGKINGNQVSFGMDISNADAIVDEEFRVHRLLAKYKINEMNEQIESGNENLKKELIDLSLQVNIVTKYTTFVAIDQDAPDKPLVINNCDNLGCQEYPLHPIKRMALKSSLNCVVSRCLPCPQRSFPQAPQLLLACSKTCMATTYSSKPEFQSSNNYLLFPPLLPQQDVIIYLVDLQNINGSWSFSDSILLKIGIKAEDFKNKISEKLSEEGWITIVIYQYLADKEKDREKEWRLVAKKAKKWIDDNILDNDLKNLAFKEALELLQ